ncbi:kinesin-domain-containing protein [Sistotremastrum suecicum HHB10207 ss-3]|uniref:Kinesin-like protein n=1 Tax=Sistotremastrum suecicum HHB10207 ss-3 TaxID=1314776 RepID=A0A166FXT4_9AGAM|nr:kinesin-domain-containing protein [Sistotremastrum suecicum HHB10207 ss-3]
MASNASITVAVRVRPPTQWEAGRLPEPPAFESAIRVDGSLASPRKALSSSNVREIIEIADDRILTFDPPDRDQTRAFAERGFVPPGSKRYKDRRFMFDRVFDGSARQVDVYEGTTRPLLDGILDGFNATVFAYGATGCGKTHTISGTDEDPGIIYLTMAELFQRIEDRKDDAIMEVTVSFLEIYNEEIRDLLVEPGTQLPRGGLTIREDKSVKVANLTELRPQTADEVKQIVLLGNQRRTQSPTHANETSSRSHAVLQVHVCQSPRTASTTETRTMATLSIIDLAGSERASATKNMGERMVEGANINKSLLALGNCINALCESGGGTRHVPYRNSKLTRLLKFSLGGNCKTVMIVCVAPTSLHFDDTHNTLIYAERATKIKTKVVTRNVVNVDRHVGQYVAAIQRLNEQVAELKAKLSANTSVEESTARRRRLEAKSELDRAKQDIQAKANQSQATIVEGASCTGSLSLAQMVSRIVREKLVQLESQASTGQLPSDLEAERSVFRDIVAEQEAILLPNSEMQKQVLRANNANSMFDAMLRAISERKSDRLDDISTENLKFCAESRRATMEQAKAVAEKNVYLKACSQQIDLNTKLAGMLARCTTMIRDGAATLTSAASNSDSSVLQETVVAISASLNNLASQNAVAFSSIYGRDVISDHVGPSSLLSFTGHSTTSISFKHPVLSAQPTRTKSSRQSVSSPRRTSGSPRKVARHMPKKTGPRYSITQKMTDKDKKTVQWTDEDGSGNPLFESRTFAPENTFRSQSSMSTGAGSESEWEDEKTDDSVLLSFSMPSKDGVESRGTKRGKNSRLTAGSLKAPTLSSLSESDEIVRGEPFTDRANVMPEAGPTRMLPQRTRKASDASFLESSRSQSCVGPVRTDKKNKRRSSLATPSISGENSKPSSSGAGPRRLPAAGTTPGKKSKRLSLTSRPRLSSLARPATAVKPILSFVSPVAPDVNGDGSLRVSKDPKYKTLPSWR